MPVYLRDGSAQTNVSTATLGHKIQVNSPSYIKLTVEGRRRRGRQRKRWEDNIKEWTGLEWNIQLRKAENHEEWRKLVVKSTVVPQRSARLRDR